MPIPHPDNCKCPLCKEKEEKSSVVNNVLFELVLLLVLLLLAISSATWITHKGLL